MKKIVWILSNSWYYAAFGLLLALAGYGLIWYAAGWLVALGLFLCLWSHNIEKRVESKGDEHFQKRNAEKKELFG